MTQNQKLLILFSSSGRKSGKTTFSNLLKDFFNQKLNSRTKIYSFADIPRRIASLQLYFLEQLLQKEVITKNKAREDYYFNKLKNDKEENLDFFQSITYRDFLISLAESVRFVLDENIWTGLLSENIINDINEYDIFIIDDHRKESEYVLLKEIFPGKILRIYINNNKENNDDNSNYFEKEIKKENCDIILNNNDQNIFNLIRFLNISPFEEDENNLKQKEEKEKN